MSAEITTNPLLREPLVALAIDMMQNQHPLKILSQYKSQLNRDTDDSTRLMIGKKIREFKRGMMDFRTVIPQPDGNEFSRLHFKVRASYWDAVNYLRKLYSRDIKHLSDDGIIPTRSQINKIVDKTNDALQKLNIEYINWHTTDNTGEYPAFDDSRRFLLQQGSRPGSTVYYQPARGTLPPLTNSLEGLPNSEWHSDADLMSLSNLLSSPAHYSQSQQDSGTPAPFFNAIHAAVYGHEL